ncbi:MAG TPA: tetratricopeptide repeat protein [Pyrinomonadaceae bacterium]|nr:tetratricopeptide repeat protein [Pyrinomonadaceae bacterium]
MTGVQFKIRTWPKRRARTATLFALLLLCVAASAGSAAAQDTPNIAGDVKDSGKKPRAAASSSNGSGRRAPATPRTPRRTSAAPPAAATTPPRTPVLLDVTFVTGVAESDIFVHAPGGKLQSLGRTGADGKLRTRMPRGAYIVTASRAGYNAQRQQINVQTGSANFFLNLSGMPLPGTVASPAEILRRFSDPRQTDSVTADEWQSVQQQTAAAFAANPGDAQVRAQSLFAEGQLAYLKRDYAGALVAFNNSALALPTSALAYYGLGNAYLATNQLPEAARAYSRAVELDGQLAMAYRGVGDVLTRQGKNKDALAYYERAKALGYFSPGAALNTGRNLMRLGRWTEAARELAAVAKAQPTAEVFIALGDCYAQLKQPLSAAPAYRRAIELDPQSAQAHARYGEVMYESREYAAAAEALERALALDRAGASINRARARKMADEAASKARR